MRTLAFLVACGMALGTLGAGILVGLAGIMLVFSTDLSEALLALAVPLLGIGVLCLCALPIVGTAAGLKPGEIFGADNNK